MTNNVTPLRSAGAPHDHPTVVDGCFRCDLTTDETHAATPLGVEQVAERDTYLVQVDATAAITAAFQALITTIRADHSLLAKLASHGGSTTPVTQGPPAETVRRMTEAARRHSAHLIDLTPAQASGLAEELDEAAREPERCMRSTCDDYVVAYGLCGVHADGGRWS